MSTDTWTIAEAKARFSELVADAQAKGPQMVTKHGRESVVVVSADEWGRKTRRSGTLSDFFAASPLKASGLKAERAKDRPRKLQL